MTETSYPSMEAALAAVQADYPDAEPEPDLAAFHGGDNHVFYNPATHEVIMVGPDEHTDGTVEGIVETSPGHELPAHPSFYESLENSLESGWGADNTTALKTAEAITRIYVAAQNDRGLGGDRGPSGDTYMDVLLPADLEIHRLRERLFMWEVVRTRVLRDVFAAAASDSDREQLSKELRVNREELLELLAQDRRRFGTLD